MEKINDLIYPYSLGCLDKEEYRFLSEHLDNGVELNTQELGEYQNLVSLLPSLLEIEIPDPQLKDNVAKKLYKLKDEIRAQRQKNKISSNIQDTNGELGQELSLRETEILPSENRAFKSSHEEESDIQKTVGVSDRLMRDKENTLIHPAMSVKKSYNNLIWVALFLLLSAGIIGIYLNIALKTNNLNNEIDKLKHEIGSLHTQLIGNQEIQEMLQSPDVKVINLTGTNLYPKSFGKVIIDSGKGIGYIKLAQLPAIPDDKLYQLWASNSGSYISLRTFQPSDTLGFYTFKTIDLKIDDNINFLITEESPSGSTVPSNKVYLQGKLNP